MLDGNTKAAEILAEAVHQEATVHSAVRSDFDRLKHSLDEQDIPFDDIGIWIDPIGENHTFNSLISYNQQCKTTAECCSLRTIKNDFKSNQFSARKLFCHNLCFIRFHFKQLFIKLYSKYFFVDATYEYVEGRWDCSKEEDTSTIVIEQQTPHRYGLRCCTVLIGGFLRSSGAPIFASVSQPFSTAKGGPTSTFFCVGSISNIPRLSMKFDVVLSSAEDSSVRDRLASAFTIVEASGAGYKLLLVALGWCSAYVLTRGTTFRWDTCAPHALLKSQGGEMREFESDLLIKYNVSNKQAASNSHGLVAYRDEAIYHKIMTLLRVTRTE